MRMKLGINIKLFLVLLAFTLLVVVGIVSMTSRMMENAVSSKIISDFYHAQTIGKKEQLLRYERLLESASLIVENSTFKANVSLEQSGQSISPAYHASVQFSVEEFAQFIVADMFVVLNKQGRVIARLGEPNRYANDVSDIPGVRDRLSGIAPPLVPKSVTIFKEQGILYQIVSVPIVVGSAGQESIVGVCILGKKILQEDLASMAVSTGLDIVIADSTGVLTASRATDGQDIQKIQTQYAYAIHTALQTQNVSSALTATLYRQENLIAFSPVGEGEQAYYVFVASKDKELALLRELQTVIVFVGGVALLIAIIVAYFIGRRVTRPIIALTHAMTSASQGDMNVTVQHHAHDEIGVLAQAFNQMMVYLRERLHLMKYVGSHTQAMVSSRSHGEMGQEELGGSRVSMAVLFSDIRGFTAYSEREEPENIVAMLNACLGLQSAIVQKFGGSIDKFVGDELMALFSGDDGVAHAIACAGEIQQAMQKQFTVGYNLSIGIGINYGPMVLGNIGAEHRMDYTVIGSTVNLAARLCSAAERGQILIRHDIVQEFAPTTRIRSIQPRQFKGILESIDIAEVDYDEQ
jgi:class 3 adenylate cyclase